MTGDDTPAVLVARFLRMNNYNEVCLSCHYLSLKANGLRACAIDARRIPKRSQPLTFHWLLTGWSDHREGAGGEDRVRYIEEL